VALTAAAGGIVLGLALIPRFRLAAAEALDLEPSRNWPIRSSLKSSPTTQTGARHGRVYDRAGSAGRVCRRGAESPSSDAAA